VKRYATIGLAVLIILAGWLVGNRQNGGNPPSAEKAPKTDVTGLSGPLPVGTGFDYYVMSLSWSPTWCARNSAAADAKQCADRRGIILHGLWPQNEQDYPEDCTSNEPERVPASLAGAYLDLIPSIGLIGHEWRKHGTCSGLSQRNYLATARAAWETLTLPAALAGKSKDGRVAVSQIEDDFVRLNPGLTPRSIIVTCEDQMLEEVRICLTRDLQFRDCGNVERSACRLKQVSIPTP
jgi:ribonuclease T2